MSWLYYYGPTPGYLGQDSVYSAISISGCNVVEVILLQCRTHACMICIWPCMIVQRLYFCRTIFRSKIILFKNSTDVLFKTEKKT